MKALFTRGLFDWGFIAFQLSLLKLVFHRRRKTFWIILHRILRIRRIRPPRIECVIRCAPAKSAESSRPRRTLLKTETKAKHHFFRYFFLKTVISVKQKCLITFDLDTYKLHLISLSSVSEFDRIKNFAQFKITTQHSYLKLQFNIPICYSF